MGDFVPWLKQPEGAEKLAYDSDDTGAKASVVKPEEPTEPRVDWFLDHLMIEPKKY